MVKFIVCSPVTNTKFFSSKDKLEEWLNIISVEEVIQSEYVIYEVNKEWTYALRVSLLEPS